MRCGCDTRWDFSLKLGQLCWVLSAALHLKLPCQKSSKSSLHKASSSLWGAFILEVHSHLPSFSSRFQAVSEVAAWPPVVESFPRSMVCRKSENRSHFLSHSGIANNKGYSKVVGCGSCVWKYSSSCFRERWYFFFFFSFFCMWLAVAPLIIWNSEAMRGIASKI